jgi:hypothetical protein
MQVSVPLRRQRTPDEPGLVAIVLGPHSGWRLSYLLNLASNRLLLATIHNEKMMAAANSIGKLVLGDERLRKKPLKRATWPLNA